MSMCLAWTAFLVAAVMAAAGLVSLWFAGGDSARRGLLADVLAEVRGWPIGLRAMMGGLLVTCVMYGGTKGRITVNDAYISDAGSYLTNDVVHVAIARKTALLPMDTEIMIFARIYDSTNAADWFELIPRLPLSAFPHDYYLADATNYNVLVAADYVPPSNRHTNGVWSLPGFLVPGFGGGESSGVMAFPGSRTKLEK